MKPAAVAAPPTGPSSLSAHIQPLASPPIHGPADPWPKPPRAAPPRLLVASTAARERMLAPGEGPVFTADWLRTVMIHFALPPESLQPHVPFELDLWQGEAYVTLVAFTQERLRPASTHWTGQLIGGDTRLGRTLGQALLWPIGHHDFLNIRTYVKHRGEAGIFFLAEFLANRLAPLIGPRLYGLPYRYGRMDYGQTAAGSSKAIGARPHEGRATVENPSTGRRLEYRIGGGSVRPEYAPASEGTVDAFCMERYTAFTERKGVLRRFRIWHEPWQQARVEAQVTVDHLLQDAGPWFRAAKLVAANQSPGVENVWIGPPRRVTEQTQITEQT